jgi:hypothetical protein
MNEMKATKYTMSITVEVLSIDSINGLLTTLQEELHGEFTRGSLTADDGDTITWTVNQELLDI